MTTAGRGIELLQAHGWAHGPEPGEDGYTGYGREDVRVELAFLARDSSGASTHR